MDKMSNSFAPVWQTSSSQRADDGNVILEGRLRASGDLKITLDFPLVKETNVSSMLTSPDQLAKSRDTEALAVRVSASTSTESSKEKKTGDGEDITTLDKIILACDHFSELSTFHGMRLLCSRGPNPVRRNRGKIPDGSLRVVAEVNESIVRMKPPQRPGILGFIWSLLIVGCLVALALQVRQQVLYFFSNPKTINEETKFVDSVEFPTVTICNENAFRISAAYNLKLYDILNNMFNSTLTLDIVAEAGLVNLTLDELNYLGGNDIHNMILKCKWNAAEACGPENFTRMITDQGLCYSFNGPTSPRNLTVETPGASRGLQLTLNIEEYERMMGSHVASGIHILIHNKREYPLVEQLGQAIAAGSHTFVALKLKKETRLGYPYDNCQDGLLLHVPNHTYTYTMPACKIECYVEFTLKKCGCRDYYMPGNSPVCTFKEYVSCLRTVQKTYDALEDKICDCYTPCASENVEVSYSYGALSKLATSKIKKDDLDKILGRFKRALDVTEYISSEKIYKKILYQNFTDFSSRVTTLYDEQLSTLSRLQQKLLEVSDKANQIYHIRLDLLWAQVNLVRKYFIEPRRTMDAITIGKVINDVHLFSQQMLHYVEMLDVEANNTTRSLVYNTVMGELKARSQLINMSLTNFDDMKLAYISGVPVINDSVIMSFGIDTDTEIAWSLIPKKLLHTAMNRSLEMSRMEQLVIDSVEQLQDIFTDMMDVITLTYETRSPVLESIKDTLVKFKSLCENYFVASQVLFAETVEWPLVELNSQKENLQSAKHACDKLFKVTSETLSGVIDLVTETNNVSVHFYSRLGANISSYLASVNTTSKFVLADLMLGRESEAASDQLQLFNNELVDYLFELNSGLNGISSCLAENARAVSEDGSIHRAFEKKSQEHGVSLENITQLVSIDIVKLCDVVTNVREMKGANDQLLKLVSCLRDDLTEFKSQLNMDLSFYSKNLIFLDIFFPAISYTVTEQQVAYDMVKLLSDIGGSMGLLVGASAISLFEFVDFFCLLTFALCWKRRPAGSGVKVYGEKESFD